MKKLVVLDGHHYPAGAYDEVAKLCEAKGIAFDVLDCSSPEEVRDQGPGCGCLHVHLRQTGRYGALQTAQDAYGGSLRNRSVDNLNLEDHTKNGIYACNVPDYGVEEVALHALGSILALERKIPFYNKRIHEGVWNEDEGYTMRPHFPAQARTAGFRSVSPENSEATPKAWDIRCWPTIRSFRTICSPRPERKKWTSTPFSRNRMSLPSWHPPRPRPFMWSTTPTWPRPRMVFSWSIPHAAVLVDTEAVIRALESGKLAGVALDVLEEEPPKEICSKLFGRENVILTPHIAYRSYESFEALKRMAGETAINFLSGGAPYNVVNKDVIGQG